MCLIQWIYGTITALSIWIDILMRKIRVSHANVYVLHYFFSLIGHAQNAISNLGLCSAIGLPDSYI